MIKVYNTLTRSKEDFHTIEPGRVRMYVCGPTTYNFIHIGNARPLVVFDIIRRYLAYRGFTVTYVQNFTDVDDKIIARAQEEGIPAAEVAEHYIAEYFRDADALGVQRADVHPRVSEHIPDIVEVVAALVAKGFAYVVDGDVYFRVRAFPSYGRLSGRSLEDMMAGARVEVDERKEDPMDFALWKQAKPGEPSWPSPWGPGRPGWHIECSVMSMKYLGPTLDVHGGGVDLVFPHHENEIAQSEAYTGQRFVNYWMHNGFITVNQEKMSKSLGNFFIVREVLSKFPADVVRFYLAATHYRSPLDFDDAKLEEAGRALERVKNALRRLDEALQAGEEGQAVESGLGAQALQARVSALVREFEEAMDDDFNTSRAMAAVFELAREANSFLDGRALPLSAAERAAAAAAGRAMRTLAGDILGLLGARGAEVADTQKALVDAAVALRTQARASRQFAVADRIRAFLGEQGIVVEDTPAGSRLSFSRSPDTEALARFLVSEWAEARRRGEESQAEAVRQALAGAGITVEEQEEGVRWGFDAAGKN